MKTRIQKWDNRLVLPIPKSFAEEAQLTQGALVDVSLVGDRLVVVPVADSAWTLKHLLAGVTEENLHGEVDTGPATGNEVW